MPTALTTAMPLNNIFLIDGKRDKVGGIASNNVAQDALGSRPVKPDSIRKPLR